MRPLVLQACRVGGPGFRWLAPVRAGQASVNNPPVLGQVERVFLSGFTGVPRRSATPRRPPACRRLRSRRRKAVGGQNSPGSPGTHRPATHASPPAVAPTAAGAALGLRRQPPWDCGGSSTALARGPEGSHEAASRSSVARNTPLFVPVGAWEEAAGSDPDLPPKRRRNRRQSKASGGSRPGTVGIPSNHFPVPDGWAV